MLCFVMKNVFVVNGLKLVEQMMKRASQSTYEW